MESMYLFNEIATIFIVVNMLWIATSSYPYSNREEGCKPPKEWCFESRYGVEKLVEIARSH